MPDESEQAEARRVLLQDADWRRRQEREEQARGSTYLHHHHTELGGRFGVIETETITGRPSPQPPPLPANSPWSGVDMVPPEPALGYSVNDLDPSTGAIAVEVTGDPTPGDPSPKGCDPLPDAADVDRDAGSPFSSGEDD
jgi:hypothetical protein